MPWLGGLGLRQGEGLMAPFLPTPSLRAREGIRPLTAAEFWRGAIPGLVGPVLPGQAAEARPVDTGAAQQQHRGQAGRDWQHGAAQSPLLLRPSLPPSWRELGERS